MLAGWARTDAGKVRSGNEDAFWLGGEENWYLALVADGMGGHQAGEVASQLAATVIQQYVTTQMENQAQSKKTVPVHLVLHDAVQSANNQVFIRAQDNRGLFGMGTTVTALCLLDGTAEIAHVGDSRAYLFRGGKLRQLTDDHSLVQELVNMGSISSAEARHHPKRHLLTRVLGTAPDLSIDRVVLPTMPGDLFLLCTDGLTGELADSEIEAVLKSLPPLQAVEELVRQALEQGGHDNVTALLVQAGDQP